MDMEPNGTQNLSPPRTLIRSPTTNNNNTGSSRKESPRAFREEDMELPWTTTARSPKHKKPRLDDPPRPELENGQSHPHPAPPPVQVQASPSPIPLLPGPSAKSSPSYLKLTDEREFETEMSSTTPPQSSSDPEQTPKSSIEGDDKTETESSKSVFTVNAVASTSTSTNGPIPGFVPPSITKRSVTLQMLLGAGILKTGEGTMSLEYHGQKFLGDLFENGQIRSQETSQVFSSPSAWATACKQIINPDKILRKSGCGWASIKYKGLKLDYYKAVWFKRLREGSIDIRNISNGASSSSSDTEDEDPPHCILKFGEHFENSPRHQSAQQVGAKVLISCTEFKEMERLQPFHIKVSAEALALADFHCNITNSETVGYISGQWNGDHNCLKLEVVHPCRVLMPHSSSIECDHERNRIALDIQRLGHEVVGWYHSHPKAPPIPSKDDIARQLDYQIMMKGATESSYIPCVGVIISPLCYSDQEDSSKSKIQFFWVMPPPENRPLEMGRPMHLDHENFTPTNFDSQKLLLNMAIVADFYREKNELIDLGELTVGRFSKIKEALSVWLTELKVDEEFWQEVHKLLISKVPMAPKPTTSNTPLPTTTASSTPASSSVPTTTPSTPTSTSPTPTPPAPEPEEPPSVTVTVVPAPVTTDPVPMELD